MIEIVFVNQWLYTLLSGDATMTSLVGNRIYDSIAPVGVAFPLVLFNFQGGSDVSVVGGVRVMNSGLYQVKAVVQSGSNASALPIANRIDALLHRATGSAPGGLILASVREQPIAYPEVSKEGIQYRHLGGLYRVIAQGV